MYGMYVCKYVCIGGTEHVKSPEYIQYLLQVDLSVVSQHGGCRLT